MEMANVEFSDKKSVMNVLRKGKELANELKRKMGPTTTSREACDALLQSIVSSYENALTLLTLVENNGDSSQISLSNLFEGYPTSEGSNPNSKDHLPKSKKRKTLPRWSEQVRVCSGSGYDGQLDDGYNWRKYGQKDILGTNHPRAYYRCTHRDTQGCLATKQVQRADEDPSIVEIIYRGKHSCRQERLQQIKKEKKEEDESLIRHDQSLKTESQETGFKEDNFPAFSFPSTPIESENIGSPFFSGFMGTSYSSPFLSPATSDSYFSLNDFGIGHSLQSSESDFAEIISNPTNFAFGDMDIPIPIDQVNFSYELLEWP